MCKESEKFLRNSNKSKCRHAFLFKCVLLTFFLIMGNHPSRNGNQRQSEYAEQVLLQMATAHCVSKALYVVTKFNIPDTLSQNHGLTASQIAEQNIDLLGVDPEVLERLMLASCACGIFKIHQNEGKQGKQKIFTKTALSELLTSNAGNSLKPMIEMIGSSYMWQMWDGLDSAIALGKPQAEPKLGMPFYDYLQCNPNELVTFSQAMEADTQMVTEKVARHPAMEKTFSEVTNVTDVGGGSGELAIALATAYSNLNVLVYERLEMERAVETTFSKVKDASVRSRLGYDPGDMFKSLPKSHLFVMKSVIHNWTDDQALTILEHCYQNLPKGGKVVCIDVIVPSNINRNPASAFLDLYDRRRVE